MKNIIPPSKYIREARLKLKLNQTELAKILGKTPPTISKYEAGVICPPSDIVFTIQDLLYSKALMKKHKS